jgi:uncharacterized cupredoxin-like copper-binding protein
MSPTVDEQPQARPLEEELAELQAEEKQLKQRLEKSQIATLVAAFVAVIMALVAMVVALTNKESNTTVMMRGGAATATHRPAAGMGAGMGAGAMHGTSVATNRTINVQLGEMYVRPSASSITAGKVTFVARNMGQIKHELMVERSPIKFDAPGKPTEDAALGMVDDMQPGASGKMTVKLTPGTYELFCNVPGHYAGGQHTTFTVTKS